MKSDLLLSSSRSPTRLSVDRLIQNILVAIVLLAGICLGQSSAQAGVIYLQNFGNDDGEVNDEGSRRQFSSVGWNVLHAVNGGDVSNAPSAGNGYYMGIFNCASQPEDEVNIPSAESDNEINGVVRIYNTADLNQEVLTFTDEFPISDHSNKVDFVSWYAAATSGGEGASLRAAVRIDDTWYVSEEVTPKNLDSNLPSEFSLSARLDTVFFGGNDWQVLKADVGEPFHIAADYVSLPPGTIEAFGFFAVPRAKDGSYLMLDTFTIDGVGGIQSSRENRSARARFAPRLVNVRDLGAKGDGIVDDSGPIQEALDQLAGVGGTVYIPAGNYRISKKLLTSGTHASVKKPLDYIEIRGDGKNATRLLGDGVDYILAGAEITDEEGNRDIIHGMTLANLTFTNFKKRERVGGVDVSYMIRWSVQSCHFVGLETGIYSLDREAMRDEDLHSLAVYIIRIQNNVFYGCSDFGIKLGRIFDLVIENNEIEHGTGGIQIGTPGDRFDAAANTVRILNNLIEGLGPDQPAILGSCWIGSQISGNYFEANMGGDIVLTPEETDGWGRGLTISANTFQPTKTQRESGEYGPIHLTKTTDTLITGNFTTGDNLIHPGSHTLGKGINITSNVLRNSAAIGDYQGAKATDPETLDAMASNLEDAERWSVSSSEATVGLHSLFGLQFRTNGQEPNSIRYALNPPVDDTRPNVSGDIILNQQPTVRDDQKILLGWVCQQSGSPGSWKPLFALTE